MKEGSYIFFFKDAATSEIYTRSLHDALPICAQCVFRGSIPERRDTNVVGQVATGFPRQLLDDRVNAGSGAVNIVDDQ